MTVGRPARRRRSVEARDRQAVLPAGEQLQDVARDRVPDRPDAAPARLGAGRPSRRWPRQVFIAFFPNPPRLFFWSAVLWAAVCVAGWYLGGSGLGAWFGLSGPGAGELPIGVSRFWSGPFLWFYLYYLAAVVPFALVWQAVAPHPWWRWSILGSALILFTTYFQVQVSVAINNWYGPFYDTIQAALSKSRPVDVGEFYGAMGTFAGIAFVAVVISVLTRFFVSHYIFRWRTAMNHHYMAYWQKLRHIEAIAEQVNAPSEAEPRDPRLYLAAQWPIADENEVRAQAFAPETRGGFDQAVVSFARAQLGHHADDFI